MAIGNDGFVAKLSILLLSFHRHRQWRWDGVDGGVVVVVVVVVVDGWWQEEVLVKVMMVQEGRKK